MDNWFIVETKLEPVELLTRETVFSIGNGYLSTRGTFEEGYPGGQDATLVHGLFDDVPIFHSELVNTPYWPSFQLFANGERFSLDTGKTLSYRRVLNLGNAVLTRHVSWQLKSGPTLDLTFERFASLDDEHILCARLQVKSIDFSGRLEFRAGLFGHVENASLLHWNWVGQGRNADNRAYLELRTRTTKTMLSEAFTLSLNHRGGVPDDGNVSYGYWDSMWTPEWIAQVEIQPGGTITADKLVTIFTSRDTPEPTRAALDKLDSAASQGYDSLYDKNELAWNQEWQQSNITIEGDDEADRALRYNIYQLLIAAPRHDDRVSIAAKGLTGFGYRGHVFWDTEIFVLPFFIYTHPEIARNLLLYRYHTLPGAREKARLGGFEGAMFAWESAAMGEETTPRWVAGPNGKELVRIWTGDIEHHISADIAYAVCNYWQVTGDDAFMRDYGAEICLDIARFWGSRAEWNEEQERYEINRVIGPDEYHEQVDNNFYTNELARWTLKTAFLILSWLKKTDSSKARQLTKALDLTPERLSHWEDVINRLYTSSKTDTHLFEQFEGFFKLKDINLQDYEPRTRSMQALLGIKQSQEYQVIKQPDVLMLLYLLANEYDRQTLVENYTYYTPRTDLTYGSSLAPAIQVILAARIGLVEEAYQLFHFSALTDLEDRRGNTLDGIHAATAGGVWQACVFGFAGLAAVDDEPSLAAHLPAHWKRLQFRIQYHGEPYQFDVRQGEPAKKPAPRLPVLGAIFDLDGVLTNTSELHYQAWKRLADEEGISFNRQDNEALRGVSRRESLLLLLKDRPYSEADLQRMMEKKNSYYLESIKALTPADLLPGASSFLEEVRQNNVRIAIGSASKNASQVVDRLGIGDLIDALSDGNSVQRQKPAPDLFLHAARKLGIDPTQCVVFEDATAGVEAALAGGMWVAGIGPVERVGAAHLTFAGLAQTCWKCVLDQFRRTNIEFSSSDQHSSQFIRQRLPQSLPFIHAHEFSEKGDGKNNKNRQ